MSTSQIRMRFWCPTTLTKAGRIWQLQPELVQEPGIQAQSQPGDKCGERAQPAARDQPAAWQQDHIPAPDSHEPPALYVPAVNGKTLQPCPKRASHPIGRRHLLEYKAVVHHAPLEASAPQALGTNWSVHTALTWSLSPHYPIAGLARATAPEDGHARLRQAARRRPPCRIVPGRLAPVPARLRPRGACESVSLPSLSRRGGG
jgi:hypothetical protein